MYRCNIIIGLFGSDTFFPKTGNDFVDDAFMNKQRYFHKIVGYDNNAIKTEEGLNETL